MCTILSFLVSQVVPFSLYLCCTDPGLGPVLSYMTVDGLIHLSCQANQVAPQPELSLTVYTERGEQFRNKYGERY